MARACFKEGKDRGSKSSEGNIMLNEIVEEKNHKIIIENGMKFVDVSEEDPGDWALWKLRTSVATQNSWKIGQKKRRYKPFWLFVLNFSWNFL